MKFHFKNTEIAHRLPGGGLLRLTEAVECILAAPRVQLLAGACNGLPHNALRYHWLVPISCQVRDCKALLATSLTHV